MAWHRLLLTASLFLVASCSASSGTKPPSARQTYCPVFYAEAQEPKGCLDQLPPPFLRDPPAESAPSQDLQVLEDTFAALTALQDQYFHAELGTWPRAIDWTAAVIGTVLSGTLTTLSQTLSIVDFGGNSGWSAKENLMNSLFSQSVGSYFGQDAVAIRNQAFDDILWVVLGWVEAIKFINLHSGLHYPPPGSGDTGKQGLDDVLHDQLWHGDYWIGAFAHRARLFWDLARSGWDTRLCNGGMNWNPKLTPYKNAVTNELWIAASISMYHHFPGDDISSPWHKGQTSTTSTRDPKYLAAAIEGYKWLMDVNMTNHQGLYADGYHVSKLRWGGTKCDQRSEAVYTYNQGVILTGQRGLWTATGSASYLVDGHQLIQSVISATGWNLQGNRPVDDLSVLKPGHLPMWRGLGRGGILEENCDASATCSQDGQTFKGIFFHHLQAFCATIEPMTVEQGMTVNVRAFHQIKTAHNIACRGYVGWLKHNAGAALPTRNEDGIFGQWWGAGLFSNVTVTGDDDGVPHDAPNVTDYRNEGLPDDGVWARRGEAGLWTPGRRSGSATLAAGSFDGADHGNQRVMGNGLGMRGPVGPGSGRRQMVPETGDPNDRGGGRTVETQTGGLALLRALWEIAYADRDP